MWHRRGSSHTGPRAWAVGGERAPTRRCCSARDGRRSSRGRTSAALRQPTRQRPTVTCPPHPPTAVGLRTYTVQRVRLLRAIFTGPSGGGRATQRGVSPQRSFRQPSPSAVSGRVAVGDARQICCVVGHRGATKPKQAPPPTAATSPTGEGEGGGDPPVANTTALTLPTYLASRVAASFVGWAGRWAMLTLAALDGVMLPFPPSSPHPASCTRAVGGATQVTCRGGSGRRRGAITPARPRGGGVGRRRWGGGWVAVAGGAGARPRRRVPGVDGGGLTA